MALKFGGEVDLRMGVSMGPTVKQTEVWLGRNQGWKSFGHSSEIVSILARAWLVGHDFQLTGRKWNALQGHQTTSLKSGALRHDIHYWLGKDTSQDETGTAAIKTVELDAALRGRAVQYRKVQGHETEKFLSYFKPCIIPQEGGVASGFKHAKADEHKTRLFVCKGKHVINVKETTSLKSGALRHDIHYWLGKDTSQDETGTAAIKTVELDAALGGRAVQYREVQGHETEKFLSYFKPCIIPQEGGVASGFKHAKADEHKTRLFVCKGKHVINVKETTSLKSGALRHDIHYWLGKDTSQDETDTAAIKTVELDAALGGRAVQYREVQGHEIEKFLSYFKPCIIPQEGGVASGFKHAKADEHKTRLFVCKGKHVINVKETTSLKSGALRHDIHYWLGKDTSQDETGTAAIKTVELDAALGGRAVQYREVQGHEIEKFLSYFKPCIIPQEGGVASGFKHAKADEHKTRLFVCKGKHVINVKEILNWVFGLGMQLTWYRTINDKVVVLIAVLLHSQGLLANIY
nr:villin-4-like [Ziziphus jujuba var. spinosa]